jgi:ATP-binding cassette, subfamily B, bacterial CvaB/MchF/RaxB
MVRLIRKGLRNRFGRRDTSGPLRGDRVEVIHQVEAAECGFACLAMVLSKYGSETNMRAFRSRYRVSLHGADLATLSEVAHDFGLVTRALRAEMSALSKLHLPCIVHWDFNHFVVLERVGRTSVEIVDPAFGRCTYGLEEFSKHFTGVVLELAPGPDYRRRPLVQRLRLRDILNGFIGLRPSLVHLLVLSIVLQCISLIAPQFLQQGIDQVAANKDIHFLAPLVLGFGLVYLLRISFTTLQKLLALHLGTQISYQSQRNLFRHMLTLPIRYFESRSVGDIVSRFESFEPINSMVTGDAISTLLNGGTAVITAILLFVYSPLLAGIVLGVLGLSILVKVVFLPAQRRLATDSIVAGAKEDTVFMETIRGMQSIKALAGERLRFQSWDAVYTDAINTKLRSDKLEIIASIPTSAVDLLDNIGIPAIGFYFIIQGQFSIGMLYAFLAYKDSFYAAAESLIDVIAKFWMNRLHLERLGDIALEAPETKAIAGVHSKTNAPTIPATPIDRVRTLELRGVSFRYADHEPNLFAPIDLTLRANENVVLIGPSGSGKTTLVKILSSLEQPSDGTLFVNGSPLQMNQFASYRRRIGMVLQSDRLFAGSVASNIAFFAEQIDQEKVVEVAQLCAIHDEIMAMPMGYETLVGDMGSSLSSGQQQRILLARSLYRNPDYLFFDEGTANIDPANEWRILKNLRSAGFGIFCVAHHPACLELADRVLELKDGKLQEMEPDEAMIRSIIQAAPEESFSSPSSNLF